MSWVPQQCILKHDEDFQALPIGPSYEGCWWWVQARLADSTLGIIAWGESVEGESERWGYLSRVYDMSD